MWISCRIRSDSHTLSAEPLRLFQLEASNIRIHHIQEHDFFVSVRALNPDAPEPNQLHDGHRVISALIIALNVGALGTFSWYRDPWVHPILTVTDDFDGSNPHAGALVVESETKYEVTQALTDVDVENIALVFGIVARERSTALTGEYSRGLLLLRMNFVDLNFRREAFMCFYRALEHFASARILKVQKLTNELKGLQNALRHVTKDEELIAEVREIYRVRSSQVAHSQNEQREVTLDDVLKTKVLLDFFMHKTFKDEANREMEKRVAEKSKKPPENQA